MKIEGLNGLNDFDSVISLPSVNYVYIFLKMEDVSEHTKKSVTLI